MGPLPLLLAFTAFFEPQPAPAPQPCLIAQLYFEDALDETAREMLERAVIVRRQVNPILIHASGMQYPHGLNGAEERSLRRGGLIRDHLIARGVRAERIRVIGQEEGRHRFGNPGDGVALVLIEYSRARVGMTITGHTHHASGCSTPVPRPFG